MPWSRSKPDLVPRRPDWLTALPYAHRGLHGDGVPENSLAAFDAAIADGHGIELDIQPCRGGAPLVFHDARLERLCEAAGPVGRMTAHDATRVRLKGSSETIPNLARALARIGGRVPLLIEIKAPRLGFRPLCSAIAAELQRYPGPVAVMSFGSGPIAWFARHAPAVLRGLVISEEGKRKIAVPRGLALRHARPDFLAYDVRSLPSPFAERARRSGLALLVWTVRTKTDRERALRYGDQIIHELPAALR